MIISEEKLYKIDLHVTLLKIDYVINVKHAKKAR